MAANTGKSRDDRLHHGIFYGPVVSRRLGQSLGVNLLPAGYKVCNFDCAYCECGLNRTGGGENLPALGAIRDAFTLVLEEKRKAGTRIDHITFSGNGEPTLHPDFTAIIDLTCELRDLYYPASQIAVLTNSSSLWRPHIRAAMERVDKALCKLDAGSEEMFRTISRPAAGITLAGIVDGLVAMQSHAYVQTMFLRGLVAGQSADNTAPAEVELWLRLVARIRPRGVMLYSVERVPPFDTVGKVEMSVLEGIAGRIRRLGIPASCYA